MKFPSSPTSAVATCSRASPPAASCSPRSSPRARCARLCDRRRRDAERNGERSACVRLDRARRHRDHRRGPRRNGHRAARTTLPMIVADEIEADWSRVRIKQSPGDEKKYGNQDTDGSRSIRHFIQPMRLCGAAARRCWSRLRPSVGAWSCRGRGEEPRSDPCRHRASAGLRRSGGGRRRAADAAADQVQLKEPARSATSARATSRSST